LSRAEECSLRPKDLFEECDKCPEMIVVPAGSFTMGSPPSELGRDTDEGPQRSVTIGKPFAVGRFAVTFDEWDACVADGGCTIEPAPYQLKLKQAAEDRARAALKEAEAEFDRETELVRLSVASKAALDYATANRNSAAAKLKQAQVDTAQAALNGYKPSDNGWGRGRRPVINVSWDHAKAYVAWLSRKTGKSYRLLSEAEREYVTRASTTTPFWWGAAISTSQANYDGAFTYGGGSRGESREKTAPVDTFQPNAWGLFQVHGNVWEWVEDCYHDSYADAASDGSAWVSGDCSRRVVRGGSWHNDPGRLRSAVRYWGPTGSWGDYLGIRVARTLTPGP
jgi:formylglycine-generating enzyme required for sulfatase activity